MRESEVIAVINSELPTNGNNEITASILRPVLIAMVQQVNGIVGNPNQLPNDKTIIEIINDIQPEGIAVHFAPENSNDTPLDDFNIGDFYNQVVTGSTIGFWQFMGEQWINLLNLPEQ